MDSPRFGLLYLLLRKKRVNFARRTFRMNLYTNFAWEDGAIGLLLCTVPLLAGGAWEPRYPSRLDEPDYSWRAVIVIGGLFGGAAGFGIGTQIKATDEFQVVSLAGGDTTKSDSTR